MRTIVEPKQYIDKLWGKQRIKEDASYRLMKYVLRVNCEGKVLLHNVVTGQLAVLDQEEAKAVDKLPHNYNPVMEQLVAEHYLVPEGYDEHQQVVSLRTIMLKLEANKVRPINSYTILPTTACNARCYYCFEQGVKRVTMTEETANQVIGFILSHCGKNRRVSIEWFGGEPTVAMNRIDQICAGLRNNGIDYISTMVTNGYLFDEEVVKKAKNLWHLNVMQICVDGTEQSYNKIKAYPDASLSPYQRVMHNIGLLLNQGIRVGLRMNFDVGNYHEFKDLLDDVLNRFGRDENLNVSAFPVIGEYPDTEGKIQHGSDEWLTDKRYELGALSETYGLRHQKTELPSLNLQTCIAYHDNHVVVRPDGGISRCAELFDDADLIGNIQEGISRLDIVKSWKAVADYDFCKKCILFPTCLRLVNCRNKSYCVKIDDLVHQFESKMIQEYEQYLRQNERSLNDGN